MLYQDKYIVGAQRQLFQPYFLWNDVGQRLAHRTIDYFKPDGSKSPGLYLVAVPDDWLPTCGSYEGRWGRCVTQDVKHVSNPIILPQIYVRQQERSFMDMLGPLLSFGMEVIKFLSAVIPGGGVFSELISEVITTVKATFGNVYEWVKTKINDMLATVGHFIEGLTAKAEQSLNTLLSAPKLVIDALKDDARFGPQGRLLTSYMGLRSGGEMLTGILKGTPAIIESVRGVILESSRVPFTYFGVKAADPARKSLLALNQGMSHVANIAESEPGLAEQYLHDTMQDVSTFRSQDQLKNFINQGTDNDALVSAQKFNDNFGGSPENALQAWKEQDVSKFLPSSIGRDLLQAHKDAVVAYSKLDPVLPEIKQHVKTAETRARNKFSVMLPEFLRTVQVYPDSDSRVPREFFWHFRTTNTLTRERAIIWDELEAAYIKADQDVAKAVRRPMTASVNPIVDIIMPGEPGYGGRTAVKKLPPRKIVQPVLAPESKSNSGLAMVTLAVGAVGAGLVARKVLGSKKDK